MHHFAEPLEERAHIGRGPGLGQMGDHHAEVGGGQCRERLRVANRGFETGKRSTGQRALVCVSELCDRLDKSSPPSGIYHVCRSLLPAANPALARDGAYHCKTTSNLQHVRTGGVAA